MEFQLNTEDGEVVVKGADGGTVIVREYYEGDFEGGLRDGEVMECADGCTATRRGSLVVWTEPAGSAARA